jgi:hypothetical protein
MHKNMELFQNKMALIYNKNAWTGHSPICKEFSAGLSAFFSLNLNGSYRVKRVTHEK